MSEEDSKKRSIEESTAEPEVTSKKTKLAVEDVKSKLLAKKIEKFDLSAAPGPIQKHELVVLSVLNEDGDVRARIKKGPLSNAERVLFHFMRTHEHDEFQQLLQITIVEIRRYVLDDELEVRINNIVESWDNQNETRPLPFTKEQLKEYMIEVADESLLWYFERDMMAINRCMTMPGALCMMMTSHN